jgi:hypothetical protein
LAPWGMAAARAETARMMAVVVNFIFGYLELFGVVGMKIKY